MAITDDDDAPLLYRDSWLRGAEESEPKVYSENNEPDDAKKARWRSIRIMYTVVFLNALCFTTLMPSLWTYLQVLDPGASTSMLGWTVSAFSVGQLIASPLFGAWANWRNSHKEPTMLSFTFAALSYAFYTYLASMPGHKDYYMIAARAILGFSAGNVAVLRSYVASATTLKERTVTMANINICASVGFICGPLLQSAFVPISYPGPVERPYLHINMYTVPALVATALSTLNATLVSLAFKEHRIKDEPEAEAASIQFLPVQKAGLDYVAVYTCIMHFFATAIIFQTFQTLTTPLIMHNFAWSKSKATFVQGFVTGGTSVLAIIIYFIIKVASKRFSERAILIAGFLFTLIACFVFIPLGTTLPPRGLAPIQPINRSSTNNSQWMMFPQQLTLTSLSPSGEVPFVPVKSMNSSHQLPYIPTSKADVIPLSKRNETYPRFKSLIDIPVSWIERDPIIIPDTGNKKKRHNARSKILTFKSNSKAHKLYKLRKFYESLMSPSANEEDAIDKHPAAERARRVLKTIAHSLRPLGEPLIDIQTPLPPTLLPTETTSAARSESPIKESKSKSSSFELNMKASTVKHYSDVLQPTPTDHAPEETEIAVHATPTGQTPIITTPIDNHEAEGCPWNLDWCSRVPALHLSQYIGGTVLYGIGYPICHVLTFTIFSKVLGPKPQGLWMGIFAASGSLAGVVGPILISHVYDTWGARVAFTGCTAFIALVTLYTCAVQHRLIPLAQRQKQLGPLTNS